MTPLILSQPVRSARRRLWSPVFVGGALHVLLSALIALEYESFFFPLAAAHSTSALLQRLPAVPAQPLSPSPMADSVFFLWAIKAFNGLCLLLLHPWSPHLYVFLNYLTIMNMIVSDFPQTKQKCSNEHLTL